MLHLLLNDNRIVISETTKNRLDKAAPSSQIYWLVNENGRQHMVLSGYKYARIIEDVKFVYPTNTFVMSPSYRIYSI